MIVAWFVPASDTTELKDAALEVLGEPLREHVLSVVRDIGSNGGIEGAPSSSAAATLIVPEDCWLSRPALQRLMRAAADKGVVITGCRDGVLTSNQGDVCAICVSSAASAMPRIRELFESGATLVEIAAVTGASTVPAHQLDPDDPPRRARTAVDRAAIERSILYSRACEFLRRGVRVRDPRSVFIRGRLSCGQGVEIDANVIIEGVVALGTDVRVGANVILANTTVGARSVIKPYSFVEDARIGSDSTVGPYGRIRPGSLIGDSVQIGNFVEVKNSEVADGARVNHLAFIGDATLGASVTIGAGTITCNHNWSGTARTLIGDGAYIGSGCLLVAPVTIGENATVGAGSTITEDVPAGKLTLARARQVTLAHWRRPTVEPDGG